MLADPHPHATLADMLMPRQLAASRTLLSNPHLELTYNARGALMRACVEIAGRGKRRILMPAYHCPSGITPAIHAGLEPVFYRVRRDLSIDFDDLYAKASAQTGAVLVIHFFGMAVDLRPLQDLRLRGVEVVEDWSHSFLRVQPLQLAGGDGDYRIYSFWKLAPSRVGGGLWRRAQVSTSIRGAMPAPPWRERAVRLKGMLEDALNHSGHTRSKHFFARLEQMRVGMRRTPVAKAAAVEDDPLSGESHYPFDLGLANSRMPWIARRLLEATDFERIAIVRRKNFSQYGRLLANSERLTILFQDLPAESCPWVFPVLLKERSAIDHLWRKDGVALHTFGIHLHSALFKNTDSTTIADAMYLAEHVLCLAIHQGIEARQIENSATTINSFLAVSGEHQKDEVGS